MSENTADILLREVAFLFAPLALATQEMTGPRQDYDYDLDAIVDRVLDPEAEMLHLLERAGLELDEEAAQIRTAVGALTAAGRVLWGVVKPLTEGATPPLAQIVQAVRDIRQAVQTFAASVETAPDMPSAGEIASALMEHLVARYLRVRRPGFWHAACLLGITDEAAFDAEKRGQFHADRIWPALSSPADQMAQTTGWGQDLDHAFLFDHLAGLALAVGLDLRQIDAPEHPFAAPPPDNVDLPALTLGLHEFDAGGVAKANLSLLIAALAPEAGEAEGLVTLLQATGVASFTADVGQDHQVTFKSDLPATAPLGLVARPRALRFETSAPLAGVGLTASAELGAKAPKESTWVSLGPLTVKSVPPVIRTKLSADEAPTLSIEIAAEDVKLGLSPENADGFVAKLVPRPVETSVGLTAGYDLRGGFYLQRGGGLVVDIPVGLGLGTVLTVLSVGAALRAAEGTEAGRQVLEMGLTGKAKLGPLGVTVEGLGADLEGGLPTTAAEVETAITRFRPPTGLGLTLEAGPVKGGGYISRDPDAGRYVGALQLDISQLGLSAFGLLDTKLPDGEDGFSLLVMVAGRFAPVPLGFGFTLSGVGGLLGLHRDIDIAALKDAVRAGTAGHVLAPKDPVGDAPQLAQQASALFPISRGQHVFGPTVKLGWGQPKELVSLDLALALTLPDPLRLVLIGRVAVAVPDPDVPLVRLNMDTFGAIDFTARTVEAEGRLYDSVIQGLPVVGGFALISRWGDGASLAFSVGGLHPAFEPPPGLAQVPRLGIDLSKKSFTLLMEGYFAITSNSVQLGARAMLRAGAAGFTLLGELGFDALVIFDPFGVDLQIYASVQVKRGRSNLCSVKLTARLTGPGPWHIQGKATIEILFFDVSASFSVTIGQPERAAISTVRAVDLLIDALRDARNWAGEAPDTALVLDHMTGCVPPGAQLRVDQKMVPLDLTLDQVGASPIAGPRRFSITGLRVGGDDLRVTDVLRGPFAPAQFLQMPDAEKLSAPGYEDLPAGAAFEGSETVSRGRVLRVPSGRAALIIDAPDDGSGPRGVRRSVVAPRVPDRTRRRPAAPPSGGITVTSETWQSRGNASGGTSYAEARTEAASAADVARTAEVTP